MNWTELQFCFYKLCLRFSSLRGSMVCGPDECSALMLLALLTLKLALCLFWTRLFQWECSQRTNWLSTNRSSFAAASQPWREWSTWTRRVTGSTCCGSVQLSSCAVNKPLRLLLGSLPCWLPSGTVADGICSLLWSFESWVPETRTIRLRLSSTRVELLQLPATSSYSRRHQRHAL